MKISEIITDKYKLRIPPTVYYDLLADVREVEEKQKPKMGHWEKETFDLGNDLPIRVAYQCSECGEYFDGEFKYCPDCGAKMESENKE